MTEIQYRFGNGQWTRIFPSDGAFDSNSERFAITTPAAILVSTGQYRIQVRARDSAGAWTRPPASYTFSYKAPWRIYRFDNSSDIDQFRFSGSSWQITSSGCRTPPCLRSGSFGSRGFSTLWLDLFPDRPPATVKSVSFDIRTSYPAGSHRSTFQMSYNPVGEYRGDNRWARVNYDLPGIRPLLLEWKLSKYSSGSGAGEGVWIDNIEFR